MQDASGCMPGTPTLRHAGLCVMPSFVRHRPPRERLCNKNNQCIFELVSTFMGVCVWGSGAMCCALASPGFVGEWAFVLGPHVRQGSFPSRWAGCVVACSMCSQFPANRLWNALLAVRGWRRAPPLSDISAGADSQRGAVQCSAAQCSPVFRGSLWWAATDRRWRTCAHVRIVMPVPS